MTIAQEKTTSSPESEPTRHLRTGKTPLWMAIATTLRGDIAAGHYAPGDKIPTEAELSRRFGVNRHTVRHALGVMAEEGLLHARRGAGVFVAQSPTDYPLSARVRFHQNLTAAGRVPAKEILSLVTRAADAREAAALHLPEGAAVHVYEGLSLADDQPIAVFRSSFPASRLPDLLPALSVERSVTRALALCGIADYIRISTKITARLATATQALHLKLREGAPLIRAVSVNADTAGVPVEYGMTWFAGERVTLTLPDVTAHEPAQQNGA